MLMENANASADRENKLYSNQQLPVILNQYNQNFKINVGLQVIYQNAIKMYSCHVNKSEFNLFVYITA